MDNDKRLKWISNCKSKSANDRRPYEDRWVRNIKLSKGIPLEDKNTRSEIRHRQMMRKDSLFIKHIWSFFDIVNLGWCAGKLCWEYSDGTDRPRYISYPTEQVYPDFTADTKSDMKYCIFVNYLTYDEMEEKEYKNLSEAKKVGVT